MAKQEFEYVADGKKHSCSFTVTDEKYPMVEVTTPWGSKSTQLGGTPAIVLARVMAGELRTTYKPMH
jgi:hypothetical protein